MTENTTQNKDTHLVIYLVWPVLSGLALAVVLAVSAGGVIAILSGFDWQAAGRTALVVLFVTLGLATLVVFWYAASEFAGPRASERVERIRQVIEVIEPEPIIPEPRFIRVNAPMLNQPAPALPSGVRDRGVGVVGRLVAVWSGKPRRRSDAVAYDHQTGILEPDAPGWVREFYDTLITVWPAQSLSRRTFESVWPGGRGKRLWRKYVNGTGNRHSQKGVWDVWGVVAQTGKRGSWEWCHDLQTIFSLDADLLRYATAKANVHSPTHRLARGPNQNKTGQSSPDQSTSPVDQSVGGVA